MDSNGRTIWIADAHRDDGKRFVVHADEKLTAFLANCEKPVPLSPPGAIAVSLLVWLAGALLMTLPVIAIFFFAQRYFLRGVTLTGIKG